MKRRCYDPKCARFEYYGGRGVIVCDQWRGSFDRFFLDVGPAPSRSHTLDRIEPTKGYEPGNCRWATHREQVLNSSRPRWIVANGEKLHVADWARRLGVDASAIFHRIRKGWSEQEAVTIPKGGSR